MAAKKTILIIEDNVMNMEMATDLLEQAGFNVIGTESAELGIEILQAKLSDSNLPDLILMDMLLPGIDGYEACEQIKSKPAFSHIPIIGFSALAMADEQKRAIDSGCTAVISKPIDIATFAVTIGGYLPSAAKA